MSQEGLGQLDAGTRLKSSCMKTRLWTHWKCGLFLEPDHKGNHVEARRVPICPPSLGTDLGIRCIVRQGFRELGVLTPWLVEKIQHDPFHREGTRAVLMHQIGVSGRLGVSLCGAVGWAGCLLDILLWMFSRQVQMVGDPRVDPCRDYISGGWSCGMLYRLQNVLNYKWIKPTWPLDDFILPWTSLSSRKWMGRELGGLFIGVRQGGSYFTLDLMLDKQF